MSELGSFNIAMIAAQIIALLIAIIGHEIMHGAAAYAFGDTTAKDEGRLSVNPIKHIDPIGTIALPLLLLVSGSGFLFGWAKPVPIDTRRVLERGGNKAMVVVSLAGVAYNLALACLAAWALRALFAPTDEVNFLSCLLLSLLMWNVILAFFNLLPIPPLDGANAVAFAAAGIGFYGVARAFNRVGMYGFIILMLILMTDLKIPLLAAMKAVIDFMLGV
ncbi:MAG: site-2 protease family protein [Helicobacteraceae bacterium]|jgi:Zn-dependent protease|nr:site-2 protease family protein [Helicobacteraceae bacterium]